MKSKNRISIIIIVLTLLVPVVLFVSVTAIQVRGQYRTAFEAEKERLNLISSSVKDSMTVKLHNSMILMESLASNPIVQKAMIEMGSIPRGVDHRDYKVLPSYDEVFRTLANAKDLGYSSMIYIASMNSTGMIISEERDIKSSFDIRERDYFVGAVANPGKVFFSAPTNFAREGEEPLLVITAARAVLDQSRNIIGVVVLSFNLNTLIDESIKPEIARTGLEIALYSQRSDDGYFEIWNPDGGKGRFLDTKNKIQFSKQLGDMGMGEAAVGSLMDALASNPGQHFSINVNGHPTMFYTQMIPESEWMLLISTPEDVITAKLIRQMLPPSVAFILLFIVLQVFSFFVMRRMILDPLGKVGSQLERLASADADLTVRLDMRSDDEVGRIVKAFNDFMDKLHGLIVEVKSAVQDTDFAKNNIIASTEETSSVIRMISGNLGKVTGEMVSLDANVSTTVSSIEQITSNMGSIDDQIIRQSSMVEESTAAITEMISSLNNAAHVARVKLDSTTELLSVTAEGKTNISDTAVSFKNIVDSVNDIENIATTIEGIASQTNLLSMNAAIEAAHAGSAGMGFSVVAEEIRKLAETASGSASQISSLIKGVISAVNDSKANIKNSIDAFDSIDTVVKETVDAFTELERAFTELSAAGGEVLGSSEAINNVTSNIRMGSAEIRDGTSSILSSSSEMREFSKRVSMGMSESMSGSNEIVKTMEEMVKESENLDSIVSKLKGSFGYFKTAE